MGKYRSVAEDFPLVAAEWHPTLNDFPASEASPGSNARAWWLCAKDPRHVWQAGIGSRTLGGVGCSVCTNKTIIPGVNDLATEFPDVAAEWHPDNEGSPETASPGSNKEYLWRCSVNAGHVWKSRVKNRTKMGIGCPYCSNKKVLADENSLAVAYPQLVSEWHPTKNTKLPTEVSPSSGYRAWWQCPKGHEWDATIYHRAQVLTGCPDCHANSYVSRFETEVADFVESVMGLGNIIRTDRKTLGGAELDIYVPSLRLAIEAHGVFWHSEGAGKGRLAHRQKFDRAQAAGVRLIQVWEDDWRTRRPAVESMLLSKLGRLDAPKIHARATEAVTLSWRDASRFLEQHHIQGAASGSHYLGLRAGGQLVAAMVLRRTGKSRELRLERYATSAMVRGGQSKLIRHAERTVPDWDSMVTFADLEVSDGGLYESTGWVREVELAPDYRYVVRSTRHHKFGFRIERFRRDPELLFEEGKTERELAAMNKLYRAWDSGKVRYRYSHSGLTHV